jgi:signal transduction histidine kinase
MRLSSLQSQLLMSYLALVAVTLCVIGLALGVLLFNNPIQNSQAFQRLADISRASRLFLPNDPAQLEARLGEVAQSNSIRILRIAPDGQVLYDSNGEYQSTDRLQLVQSGNGPPNHREFRDLQGQSWLAFISDLPPGSPDPAKLVLAVERPRFRFLSLLEDNLFRSFLEAGVIGFAVSLIFAGLISHSVAHPLRQISHVASFIARGDYTRRTQPAGPREVRELADAFNRMADQVQQAQLLQKDFLANITHELKTPLTSIQGYAQAILDRASAEPQEAANVIYEEAGRMQRLVEELLDLAKMESGQLSLRNEEVNFGELLMAVIRRFEPRAQEREISLSCDVNDLPSFQGDGDRLVQLFVNLVDNAFNHTPKGGMIRLHAEGKQGGIAVTLQDNGAGIAPEDISRIFERFYQADKSRSRRMSKGTGLGLAISKEIVQAHAGRIYAESHAGRGAIFHVWLPTSTPTHIR